MRPRRRDPQRAGSVGQVERSTRYRNLANPFAPVRIFSDDQVENMHLAALGILERQGMRVLSPRGRAVLAGAGASGDEASQMGRPHPRPVTPAPGGGPSPGQIIRPKPPAPPPAGGRTTLFRR